LFRAGIYIGWVGFRNLGDEAMYELCRERFPSIHWSRIEDVAYAPHPVQFLQQHVRSLRHVLGHLSDEVSTRRRTFSLISKAMHKLALLSGREVAIYGGGTLINRNAAALENYISVRNRIGSIVPTFGTGVINPEFWSTREDGWSDRRKEWVSVLAELPVVGVRGPISKALLDDAGATNVIACGDPAVAYHAPYVAKPRLRHTGPLRIGINTGDCSGHMWGRAEDVEDSLVALARWLHQSGHKIDIIPVWQNDVEACLEVARRAELDRSVLSPVCYTHEAFLRRVERLDLLVCLKLHAGVLAAAANVPFVSLEYQPKCRDFAASIGWEFVIRTDELKPGKLIDVVSSLMSQLDTKSAALCRAMCDLMSVFEKYCADVEPLLNRAH
jgi:hypothetical protein